MTSSDLVQAVETALRGRFPTVIVRDGFSPPMCGDRPVLDVFFVPDAQGREFMQFVREELPDHLVAASVPPVLLIPHGEDVTREYYPGVRPAPIPTACTATRFTTEEIYLGDAVDYWQVSSRSPPAPAVPITIDMGSIQEGFAHWVPQRRAWKSSETPIDNRATYVIAA